MNSDETKFMECCFAIDERVLPVYYSAYRGVEFNHRLERAVNDRFGDGSWEGFLKLEIGEIAWSPIEVDAPWFSEEEWLKEVFYAPSEDSNSQLVYIPQSRNPEIPHPGQAVPGELAYYQLSLDHAPLMLKKKDGAWFVEFERVQQMIDPKNVQQSVREMVAFQDSFSDNYEHALRELKSNDSISMLELKKVAFDRD